MSAGATADPVGDRARVRPTLTAPRAEARAAIALLTRLPVRTTDPGRTGSGAFAVVGVGLGALAAVPAVLLAGVAPLLGAALAVAAIEVTTGALHLDGLADTADALAAPDAARAEAARSDPRVGSAGAGAIVLAVAAIVGALVAIPGAALPGALLVAGAASRAVPAIAAPFVGGRRATGRAPAAGQASAAAAVPGAAGAAAGVPGAAPAASVPGAAAGMPGAAPAARPAPAGFGAWFAAGSGPGGAAVALGTCFLACLVAVAIAAWAPFGSSPATPAGLVAPLAGAAAGLVIGLLVLAGLARRFGAVVGDHYGAAIEIAFGAALAAQAVALGIARP